MAKLASTMLTFSTPESSTTEGKFLNAILDRLCPTEEDGAFGDGTAGGGGVGGALYPRILALTLLRKLHGLIPHVVQNQLLTAVPDGLNRLIALLGGATSSAAADTSAPSPPEELRNDILRLLTDLSSQSSNAARLVIFSEGYERALSIATDPISQGGEGGCTVATPPSWAIVSTCAPASPPAWRRWERKCCWEVPPSWIGWGVARSARWGQVSQPVAHGGG